VGALVICLNEIRDDLHAYAEGITKRFRMLATAPACGLASFSEAPVQTLIMHRDGAFQTELCMFGPGVIVPEHHHPGVDSIEWLVAGSLRFKVNGQYPEYARALRGRASWRFAAVRINEADLHTVEVGEKGAAFLSIQRWRGARLTHIGDNWVGAPCSDAHGKRWQDDQSA
jgi:hypothetical protein